MPGWMYYGNTNGFDIWENEHYIPMGFTYDSYVTEKDYENTSESYRELLMLKGIVLTDKQVSKWGDMLSPLDTSELSYTKETYKTDCENRAKLTCDTFEYTNTGFNATITASRDVPVFFSIPYENGWSAYVNGEKVDIEKVNVGFMAIRVNAGTNVKIEFKYRTPGLLLGMGNHRRVRASVRTLYGTHAHDLQRSPRAAHPPQYGAAPALPLCKKAWRAF